MAAGAQLLETQRITPESPSAPQACTAHRLQFYSVDAQLLISNVGEYIMEGLDRGEGILIVATPEHQAAFERNILSRTGPASEFSDVSKLTKAKDTGQFLSFDAQELLSSLLLNGELDWPRFERIVGGILKEVRPRVAGASSRAFGEMVGLLWTAGQFELAKQLEDHWNVLMAKSDFQLFCAYPIDIFAPEFRSKAAADVMRSHTHLLPSGDESAMQLAVERAGLEVVHASDHTAEATPVRTDMPAGEAKILWLHENHPGLADEILAKARHHYNQEKRFRALVENSADAIALTDPRGSILYASPSTSRILGYIPAAITGKKSGDFIHPADRDQVCRTMHAILNRPRTPLQMEFRARHRNGSWCWIEATGSNLLEEPDIEAIAFNYRDVTNRKATEMALRESEASLRDANAGLEQFAYAAAHDLQEPIRNVAIYIELLAEKYHDRLDAEANEFIKVATEGALRMQTLTRDLLAFTRSLDDHALAPKSPLDCTADSGASDSGTSNSNGVFAEVVANLQAAIRASGARVTRDELPPLPMHAAHLLQLLQNLIGNSLKYRGAEAPEVHVSARAGDDEWIVSVADNGVGVPVEYQDQIFGIFKRLHGREFPGNGIGLAICARVVNRYQGKIWVRPRSGGGSIFSFSLAAPEACGLEARPSAAGL